MKHEKQQKKKRILRFRTIFAVGVGFAIVAALLLIERQGITAANRDYTSAMLSEKQMENADTDKPVDQTETCLFLWNSGEDVSTHNSPELLQVLRDMRVPVKEIDVAKQDVPSEDGLSAFRTVVVSMNDLDALSETIFVLCDYVEDGGRMFFPQTLSATHTFEAIASRLGIIGVGDTDKVVHGFRFTDGFMIGGDDRSFPVEDVYESALNVGVDSECRVYATDSEEKTPLIWERDYGKGEFVITNFGYSGKIYRGIYAAAYSLLEDVALWPVIDASSFYLDDFPAPVPEGDSTWIERDYQLSIADFYTDIWWPDVMKLMEQYEIRYTGAIIETDSDQVTGTLGRSRDTGNFYYYGDLLLNAGGELGIHGYNHQPLAGPGFVYQQDLGYKLWDSVTEMRYSLKEVYEFASAIFPDSKFAIYVPPSDILSDEGRKLLGDGTLPEIRAIASTYFPGGDAYAQEFGVAEDGITETPRVISGTVFDDDTKLAALSELNFHFVNSHSMNPDDLLDPDRGAELGWSEMKKRLTGYLEWLTQSAPQLPMTSGSEMAGKVERYSMLSVKRVKSTEREEHISFSGLVDEAWCLMRFNAGTPGEVSGGELSHITGDLYLLHVTDPEVSVLLSPQAEKAESKVS